MDTQKFDEIVFLTVTNIFTLTKKDGFICLDNLDVENPNHLFLVHCANICKTIMAHNGKTLPILVKKKFTQRGPVRNWFKANKMGVKFAGKKYRANVDVVDLITFQTPMLMNLPSDEPVTFGEIYETFWKRGE